MTTPKPKSAPQPQKVAAANLESLHRVFTIPEGETSTLNQIEEQISKNLMGFLRGHIVAGDTAPRELERDFMDTVIPEDPLFVSEQADFLLSKVVAQSVHTSSPSFVGHMTSALPYFMLPLAKIMMALNQNVVKIETSKAFTPLERQVIGMLHRLVYRRNDSFYTKQTQHRQQSLGVFCSGGTVANITALWAARNRLLGPDGERFAGVNNAGLIAAMQHYKLNGMAIVLSKRAHYSFAKTADLLGIGKANLIKIETDDDNKIIPKDLAAKIHELKKAKFGILAVVGVAGTTETGSVDPLDAIADICAAENCHFHVDAAWGGPTLFSDRHRNLLKGIERADSVIIDAHKQLYVPIGAGIALFKDPAALTSIEQNAKYVIRTGSRDLGKHTLEGTRPGMAMLVHSGLRIIGRRGYELLIDQGIEKAKMFAELILKQPDFELISAPELNLLTYRYVPEHWRTALASLAAAKRAKVNEILNELTENIQKAERTAGKTFVSRTTLEPILYNKQATTVFRVVLANPLTTMDILQDVLNEQRALAGDLVRVVESSVQALITP